MKQTREQLEQEFVNVYRATWGGNAGLSSKRIKSMTNKELKDSIESLRSFPKS